MNDKQFYDKVNEIVSDVLTRQGLLIGQWRLGTVDQIISPTKLKVFIDGSDTPQTVSCNPDITFTSGNHVWVIYINGNARDKFVLSKRAVEEGVTQIDPEAV